MPVSSIKYLGVYLNEFLDGSLHCAQLQPKLQRATGMIAKIRHYLKQSPPQLHSIYHSIFSSHMIYGCQTWGLTDNKYTNKIQTLQNRALRLITFADSPTSPYHHMAPIYKDLKLLKFRDFVTLKNLLFVHDYFNNNLPESFAGYFTRTGDLHAHNTRNASQEISTSLIRTRSITEENHSSSKLSSPGTTALVNSQELTSLISPSSH